MSDVEAVERLLDYLQKPEASETIEKLVRLLENLDRSGVLDLLIAVTEPEVVERLAGIIVSTGLLRLLDNLEPLMDALGRAGTALVAEEEPKSLSQILAELKDPAVRRGLARLLAALRELGSD